MNKSPNMLQVIEHQIQHFVLLGVNWQRKLLHFEGRYVVHDCQFATKES